ncbi:Antitoxin HigA [hydrothermal vent metagenome]|uniref:Antitoxin HigA n=1 Tax=hydrothermal vent metagenome TaxID=652676 RepID=A0A3B0X7L5_9ZZZZ
MRIPTHREPTHSGEMLREEFLRPMEISQRDLADAIHVPCQRVNELINKKRGVSADYWLNLQIRCDLYRAQKSEKTDIDSIKNFQKSGKMA